MTSPASSPSSTCARCGAPGNGRFCSACGASLTGSACGGCESSLSPGARFCHHCGLPVADAVPIGAADRSIKRDVALPWAFAAIALVALIALFASQRIGASGGTRLDVPLNALPQAALGQGQAGVPAPDISQMSDREQAIRLFDRVMMLSEERARDSLDFAAAGKEDSLQFFAQMAIQAHVILEPRDADVRYDLGRIAEVAGVPQLARAQADSILARQPTHLLGLILAASAARRSGETQAANEYERRLLSATPTEETRALPEYSVHRNDIIAAVEQARARTGAPSR